ncbi:hypothetical protein [Leisingera sp.]|uniref:hypothetical protein n=1 Tax=Leisingera sp. TaxID=1879318 RepID=UPI002B26F46A|nr:hypothetical protein [Leisingera sp.]
MVTWPAAVVILYLLISAWATAAAVLASDKDPIADDRSLVLAAFVVAWITPAILAASFFKKPRK